MAREMRPIQSLEARNIAARYGYDQVIIIGRRVGCDPAPHGECVATGGMSPEHSKIAADVGNFLAFKVMHWDEASTEVHERLEAE